MNISLRWIILCLTTVPLIVVSVLFYHQTKSLIAIEGQQRVDEFRATLMQRKKQELKCLSEIAYRATKKYYEYSHRDSIGYSLKQRGHEFKETLLRYYKAHKERFPRETIQQFMIDFVKVYRFDNGVGYFFINDFHPKMICHPVVSKLDGTDLTGYKDSRGVSVFTKMVDVCKKDGEGFVSYRWLNPKTKKEEEKISFVFTFEPFGWIIGTGEYHSVLRNRLQKKARETLRKLRYTDCGYFWINDFNARMIMHPIRPELVGQNMMDYKDANGIHVFKNAVDICSADAEQGFIEYVGPKPGSEVDKPKLSYVRTFKEWRWIIGTGVYLDDVKLAVKAEEQRVEQEIAMLVDTFGSIALTSVLLIGLITIFLITRYVNTPLERIISTLSSFDNDLTTRLGGTYRFEFASLAESFNGIIDSLQKIISSLHGATDKVTKSAADISGVVEGQAAQLAQQSAAIAEITATVEELSASSSQIADNASTVLSAAKDALSLSQSGAEAVQAIAYQMERLHEGNKSRKTDITALGERSREISEIMELINDIAEQTKLIAFNAALEASSAGEAGKRFGVVAGEIRNLADNVMESTHDISGKVKEIQLAVERMINSSSQSASDVEAGLATSQKTVELIDCIVTGAEETTTAARQISLSTQQQKSASSQIVTAMREISDGANETAENLATVTSSATTLQTLATDLDGIVSQFRVEK